MTGKEIADNFSSRVSYGQVNSVTPDKYSLYLTKTEAYGAKIDPFYEEKSFRRQRLKRYSNNQRSHQNMLHRFAQKFGSPGEVIIGFGDWIDSRKAKRTGKRSFVKGKSMRKLFPKFGNQVFLVDEYRTSKCCSSCTLLGTEGFCSNLKDDKVRDPNWKIKLNRKKKKLQKEVVEYNQ
ncbi:hypothetical protein GEMRC1_003858 [Eukaryota sp. GEM-RC1]